MMLWDYPNVIHVVQVSTKMKIIRPAANHVMSQNISQHPVKQTVLDAILESIRMILVCLYAIAVKLVAIPLAHLRLNVTYVILVAMRLVKDRQDVNHAQAESFRTQPVLRNATLVLLVIIKVLPVRPIVIVALNCIMLHLKV